MDSPPLSSMARPWTPPENDSPRSDYFSDPFRPPSNYGSDIDITARWSPNHADEHAKMVAARCDNLNLIETHHLPPRPKLADRITDTAPHTPIRSLDALPNGPLRYPYTPDSSRMLRRCTEIPSSPPAWDTYSDHSASPVQDALSSCIAHFENLIHSQHPDEDQLEYIVAQFEAMTSFLSSPVSNHLENTTAASPSNEEFWSKESREEYISQVSSYISGVKTYTQDLKMRLDEVRTLNSIQLDVITDLRCQMQSVSLALLARLHDDGVEDDEVDEDAADEEGNEEEEFIKIPPKENKEFGKDSWQTLVPDEDEVEDEIHSFKYPATPDSLQHQNQQNTKTKETCTFRTIHIVRKPYRRSFWGAFGEAVDAFGGLFLEYEGGE